MGDGPSAGSTLQFDQPSLSMATISGFVVGDTIALANTTATSLDYNSTEPGAGTLRLFNGTATPVATLTLAGTYASTSFTLTQTGSTLQIATVVTDATTGTTATPTGSPVFRFFETTNGAHLFTASIAERDSILLNRPDLVQETNGFGAPVQASVATSSVFRFFEGAHDTFFYTASATERDAVIATRPELKFEPTSTFLADSTPQPGDVAVYRLFSKTDGSHLYTASITEQSALTTAGSAAYRPDLISEGISFYAPAGTYT